MDDAPIPCIGPCTVGRCCGVSPGPPFCGNIDALTVYRTHPVEAIFSLRGILVHAVVIGGFYFFGSRVELVTILGANVFLRL